MSEFEIKENKTRRTKRILALVISGIYIVIILPLIGILVSLYVDSLQFDGTGDYVALPTDLVEAGINLTISAWIKRDITGTWQGVTGWVGGGRNLVRFTSDDKHYRFLARS